MSTRCTGSCMPGCRRAPRRPNRGPPQVWPIAYRSFTRESVRVALREMASRKRPDVVGADLGAFEAYLEAGALVASAWRRRVAARRGALRRGWGVDGAWMGRGGEAAGGEPGRGGGGCFSATRVRVYSVEPYVGATSSGCQRRQAGRLEGPKSGRHRANMGSTQIRRVVGRLRQPSTGSRPSRAST
jgi:hypothetical protein